MWDRKDPKVCQAQLELKGRRDLQARKVLRD
jgi:hypothetical protein